MAVELWIGIGVGAAALVAAVVALVVVAVRRRRALPGGEGRPEVAASREGRDTVLARLRHGLARTKGHLVQRLDDLFAGGSAVDAQLLDQLEEVLITADVGVKTTSKILEELRRRLRSEEGLDAAAVRDHLRDQMASIVRGREAAIAALPAEGPLVIMVVGVNGSGKTTTIGKLAGRYRDEGKTVLLAAADTFRAAAIEQLEIWGERVGAEVVKRQEGSDPASVVHDALTAALSRDVDVVIADTAGRLHTKAPLMEELGKVHRVMGKKLAGCPHETLLVIDANNGQNAIAQARTFSEAVGVTGIVLTKLDGTAKGGVIVGICDELGIPVKLIGIGEKQDDLRDFAADDFIAALFGDGSPPADA